MQSWKKFKTKAPDFAPGLPPRSLRIPAPPAPPRPYPVKMQKRALDIAAAESALRDAQRQIAKVLSAINEYAVIGDYEILYTSTIELKLNVAARHLGKARKRIDELKEKIDDEMR